MSTPSSASADVGEVRVVFREVGHRYGARRLFAGLSASLEQGEVVVIRGPNGAGKSTLLRLIAGLLRPSTGHIDIEWRGRTLGPAGRRAAIGYAAPDCLPYRALTVRENLDFFRRVRGLAGAGDTEDIALLGLSDRLDQPVAELSSGYVQRVRLAVALVHRPPVLLLDEPGVTLDDQGYEQLGAVIARQRERGIVVLAANDPRDMEHGTSFLRLGG